MIRIIIFINRTIPDRWDKEAGFYKRNFLKLYLTFRELIDYYKVT